MNQTNQNLDELGDTLPPDVHVLFANLWFAHVRGLRTRAEAERIVLACLKKYRETVNLHTNRPGIERTLPVKLNGFEIMFPRSDEGGGYGYNIHLRAAEPPSEWGTDFVLHYRLPERFNGHTV